MIDGIVAYGGNAQFLDYLLGLEDWEQELDTQRLMNSGEAISFMRQFWKS